MSEPSFHHYGRVLPDWRTADPTDPLSPCEHRTHRVRCGRPECVAELRPAVAALFVDAKGLYPQLLGSENCWDEERDARLYEGPQPVIAHPPCARWCRMAKFVQSQKPHLEVGDDHGTFSAALAAVRRWGGVLEHPAWSIAWAVHGLTAPPAKGWHLDIDGGWSCEVAQGAYGHRATKLTWLYYVGDTPPPPLDWLKPRGEAVVSYARNRSSRSLSERLSQREASATPEAFARVLIALAAQAKGGAL